MSRLSTGEERASPTIQLRNADAPSETGVKFWVTQADEAQAGVYFPLLHLNVEHVHEDLYSLVVSGLVVVR
jgi:hypothetical protein